MNVVFIKKRILTDGFGVYHFRLLVFSILMAECKSIASKQIDHLKCGALLMFSGHEGVYLVYPHSMFIQKVNIMFVNLDKYVNVASIILYYRIYDIYQTSAILSCAPVENIKC